MSSNKSNPAQSKHYDSIEHWDIETDIVVVGFGGAGACAALEASDAGSSVLLLEVSSASGGSTALSSAEIYMGGNGGTRVQQACGYEDSSEDMFNYLKMAAGELADEARITKYVDGSVDHFNWLIEKGVPYKDSEYKERAIMALTDDCILYTGNEKAWPFRNVAKPCPRGHNLEVEGDNGGPLLMKILTEQVSQRDNITVKYETRGLCLINDDSNTVRGMVIREDGVEKTIKTSQGVILCAGGFVMNEEMLKRYAPGLLRANMPIGNPFDTGTGILMGQSVGGATINMHEGFVTLPFYPHSDSTYGIFLNSQAQRFVNEDCYHGRVAHQVLKQVGDRIFLIFSAEGYEPPTYLGADIAGTGETYEELAEELGLDADMLRHTVEFYNKHAANGEDPSFHKSAEWLKPLEFPLAALDCTPGRGALFPYFTLGGLHTTPDGEVLDLNQNIIPGLFAAGRTSCGIPRSAAGYSSGMSVGDATFFGRMAGLAAAKR